MLAAAGTIAQGLGLTFLLLGLRSSTELVPNRERDYDSALPAKPPPVRWSVLPFAAGAPLGLTLSITN